MEVLSQFGLQPVLLVAQIVNFLILLFLLKKFLYGPIVKMLEERKGKIAQSLKDAEEIEKKLAQTEVEREKALEKAAQEAKQILGEATQSANQIITEAKAKASEDMAKVVSDAKNQIEAERLKMQEQVRGELANLVMVGLQKISGKVLTKKDQQDIINKSIKDL